MARLFLVVLLLASVRQVLGASGDLYVADHGTSIGTGSIDVYTPAAAYSVFASDLSSPECLAFDSAGNLFVGDNFLGGGSTIYKYTPDGNRTTFATGLQSSFSLAFDKNGNLFVADNTARSIVKITPGAVQSVFASGLNNLYGLAFDGNGNLFATENGGISKFAPDGSKTVFVGQVEGVSGSMIAFDGAGNLYCAGSDDSQENTPAIIRFTPAGVRTIVSSGGFTGPWGLAFDASGNLFFTDNDGSTDTIYKTTPQGTRTVFATHSTRFTESLAFAGVTLPVSPPPSISIAKSGSQIVVQRTGVLQRSDDLSQWADIQPQPVNPWTFAPAGKSFFRARAAAP